MNSSDSAQAIYFIVLLVFVLSSFLVQARGRSAETWKAARLWGVIVAVIVLLVSFRGEFGMIKDRIVAEVDPASAQVSKSTVSIRRSSDGHFHVNAVVNDTDVNFIVDTGASSIVLSKLDATRAGINTEALAFNGVASTANGQVPTAQVTLDQMVIGSIKRARISAEVNDGAMDGSLLGMSFLNSLSGFSVHGDELILQP